MVVFDPLWETMKKKGISTYALINDYGFSKGTLDSLKQNRNVTVNTLDVLCRILECDIQDVAKYIKD